jgi:transglutaminase-like putative cysteine protease
VKRFIKKNRNDGQKVLHATVQSEGEKKPPIGMNVPLSMAIQLLFSNLFAIAISGMLLPILGLPNEWARLLIFASFTSALCILGLVRQRLLMTMSLVIVILAGLALIFPDTVLTSWYSQYFINIGEQLNLWFHQITGQISPQDENFGMVSGIFTIIITVICFLASNLNHAPILMLLTGAALYGASEYFLEDSGSPLKIYFFLSIFASLYYLALGGRRDKNPYTPRSLSQAKRSMNAGETTRRNSAVLLAAVLILFVGTFDIVLPEQFFTSRYLKRTMEDIVTAGRGKGPPTSYYLEFSLAELGYQPLEARLGGTAVPDTGPFVVVETDGYPVWLKGVARREYTGRSWRSEGMNPRWLFNDDDSVEEQRIAIGVRHQSEDPYVLQVARNTRINLYPRRNQQVLFQTGRPGIIRPLNSRPRFDAYFNRTGSIYLNDFVPEQGYTSLGQSILPLYLQTEMDIDRFIEGYDTPIGQYLLLSQDARKSYLQLPDMPELEAEVLAFDEILHSLIYRRNNAMTDAVVIAGIREALSSKIEYSLEAGAPEENEEFVGWFLREKTGYCSFFATAVTVLARQAGIPARYVEGFLVPATAPGRPTRLTLTGERAHAWSEVWFDKVGWIPVDATPSGTLSHMIRTDFMTGELPNETVAPTEPEIPPSLPEPSEMPELPMDPELLPTEPSTWKGLPLLLRTVIALTPLLLFLLWRYIAYHRRHDEAHLLEYAKRRGDAYLLQSIISDLFTLWAHDGRIRRHGETLRSFILRVERERYENFPTEFVTWYETFLYAPESESITISQGDWRRLIDFHREEELYLRQTLGHTTWFFKRWLTSFQIRQL